MIKLNVCLLITGVNDGRWLMSGRPLNVYNAFLDGASISVCLCEDLSLSFSYFLAKKISGFKASVHRQSHVMVIGHISVFSCRNGNRTDTSPTYKNNH